MNSLLLCCLLQLGSALHESRPVRVSSYLWLKIPVVYCTYRYQPHHSIWLFKQHETLALGLQLGGQPRYYPLFRTNTEQQQP